MSDPLLEEEEGATWLTTYGDLVTLLLCFFVILYAMSTLDKKKFELAAESLKSSFGTGFYREYIESPESPDTEIPLDTNSFGEEDVVKDIKKFIKQKKVGKYIKLKELDGVITITLSGGLLFSSGKSNLKPKARKVLDDVISIISEYEEYNVNIKGHTDNVKVRSARFPSNWELSAVRATTVLRYVVYGGISPKRMTATGYAHTIPVRPNNSTANRKKNRRVEFVLVKK
ncbi:MAG: flagellar motor protein MotB [Desulfobacterales bacterium]|nr:flagellar motor protein MotB [Desulfobacterales bacterium]MCP4159184.1 flagellar motor protein MotB [Deltaproteobacteria bacterium]